MAAQSPLVRQWLLLKTLAARRYGVTVREMADELEVSQKTIRRDLDTFVGVGFPLQEQVCEHGQKMWSMEVQAGDLPISFAFDEALALYLGRRFLEPLAGTLLWEAAQSAFRKVETLLGPTAREYLTQMSAALHVTTPGTSDYSRKSESIDALMQAIEEHKATHIVYQSARATEPVTYEINPYGLVYHRSSLYLVADSREHGEIRHFKVDRIEEVDVSRFPFSPPEGFDIRKHLAGSLGIFHGRGDISVKIRFRAPVARYVAESTRHPTQRLTRLPGGALVAEFRLSALEEIKSWVLSFGAAAEVLEPIELRREISEEMQKLATIYNGDSETSVAGLPSRNIKPVRGS